MRKEKRFVLLGWVIMAAALALGMFLATPAKAACDWKKAEALMLLTAEKGEVDPSIPGVYLQKIERVNKNTERRLYFVVKITISPTGQVLGISGIFCNEELWEKKIIGNKSVIIVTQKMSSNGGGFLDGFVLKDEEGSVISHDSHAVADVKTAEKWLDGFLAEMIEFGQTLPDRPDPEAPPEEPAPAPPTKVVPKWNDITI